MSTRPDVRHSCTVDRVTSHSLAAARTESFAAPPDSPDMVSLWIEMAGSREDRLEKMKENGCLLVGCLDDVCGAGGIDELSR